jgi:hypothetical protein
MWLLCSSMLDTDLLPHSTCGSFVSVFCPLRCCMQYMWLVFIDLLYSVHVAHVHWSAVFSTRGSCPLTCCMQYTWLMSTDLLQQYTWLMFIDLLHAVHVAHVHWPAVCSTRGSFSLMCCMQYTWLMSTDLLQQYTWLMFIDLLYAVNVAMSSDLQYAVYVFPIVSVCRPLTCSTRYMWLPCFNMLSIDRLYILQVNPMFQYSVYWSTVRSKSDKCFSMLPLDKLPSY